jgi:hypothetical protein
MAYDRKTWAHRLAERADLSMSVTHLTRPAVIDGERLQASAVLVRILMDRRIRGSTTASGFIVGDRPAVCFQDAPLPWLAQNLWYERKYREENAVEKVRYAAFGLLFNKEYIYRKGGRPVVYDRTAAAKLYLPREEWWRIVNFDLTNDESFIDWTHEREWRLPGDLEFELDECIVLVAGEVGYHLFVERARAQAGVDLIAEIKGIVSMAPLLF